MQDMQVSELVARMRTRSAQMRATAEEYEIEARFHSDKALDLRLGAMELDQRITFITEFVEGEPDKLPAAPPAPVEEVVTAEAGPTTTGEASPPATSPVTISAAPESHAVDGADPAKHAAEEHSSERSGEVQDRVGESTSPPPIPEPSGCHPADPLRSEAATREDADTAAPGTIPTYSRAGHVGTWVRGDEKAADAPPAGGEPATPPAPTIRERVQALHDDHPEYTARQAREALDLTKGSLSGHSSALGITWAPAEFVGRPVTPSKMDRVRTVHEQHPMWTARMIANHLGEKETSVSTMLATIRKRAAAAAPEPEFAGRQEMVEHYGDVAKRLGKP